MKAFGRVQRVCNAEGLVELAEVTFQTSPEVLREIAGFLLEAAKQMEGKGTWYGHLHIQDEISGWADQTPERPDVIVAS